MPKGGGAGGMGRLLKDRGLLSETLPKRSKHPTYRTFKGKSNIMSTYLNGSSESSSGGWRGN